MTSDAVRTYLTTVRRWMDGDLDLAMPGGETGAQVVSRFDAVVDGADPDRGRAQR